MGYPLLYILAGALLLAMVRQLNYDRKARDLAYKSAGRKIGHCLYGGANGYREMGMILIQPELNSLSSETPHMAAYQLHQTVQVPNWPTHPLLPENRYICGCASDVPRNEPCELNGPCEKCEITSRF